MSAHRRRQSRRQSSRSESRSSIKSGYDLSGQNVRRRPTKSGSAAQVKNVLVAMIVAGILLLLGACAVALIWVTFVFSRRSISTETVQNIVLFPAEKVSSENAFYIAQFNLKNESLAVLRLPIEQPVEYESLTPRTITAQTGIMVDELWLIDSPAVFMAKNPSQLAWALVKAKGKITWTFADRLWFWWQQRGFRSGKVKWSEGQTVTAKADAQKWLSDLPAVNDAAACSLSLLNTTDTSGVVSKLGRSLTDNGLVVVRMDDQPGMIEDSRLLVDAGFKAKCEQIISRLKRALPSTLLVTETDTIFQNYRAPLVILVAKDLVPAELQK